MKLKKLFATMLIAVITTCMLSACGGSAPSGGASSAPEAASTEAAPTASSEAAAEAEEAAVEVPEGSTAWTVTCPWAPSGVAAMVSQKAAALSPEYSDNIVLVATAEKGNTATVNSWLMRVNDGDPELIFGGEGMFSITTILEPELMNYTWDDFIFIDNLYSSIFVMSANPDLGIDSVDSLKAYLEEGNTVRLAANGAVGSEAFLAAALIGSMGFGDQLEIIPYESAAEAAQAVSRGETDLAISHQSQILETFQQGGVNMVCAFDENDIDHGVFEGVEGVGKHGYPYFRNRCFILAKAGTADADVQALKQLYKDILSDEGMVEWLNDTMLLEADMLTDEEVEAHINNVKAIVEEYKDIVSD